MQMERIQGAYNAFPRLPIFVELFATVSGITFFALIIGLLSRIYGRSRNYGNCGEREVLARQVNEAIKIVGLKE